MKYVKKYLKRYWKLLVLAAIIAAIFLSPLRKYINLDTILQVVESIKANPYAPFIYVGVYIAGMVFFVPGFVYLTTFTRSLGTLIFILLKY